MWGKGEINKNEYLICIIIVINCEVTLILYYFLIFHLIVHLIICLIITQ